ncbi:MAG: phospholipase D-like domain-containing protein [bacterium]|nr:phospholipase D-like domain-containing protein [bacterium]
MTTEKLRKIFRISFFIAVFASAVVFVSSCQPAAVDDGGGKDDDTLKMETVEAMIVANRDYYPVASGIFKDAKKTIRGIMYDMKFYPGDDNDVMKLIDELVIAEARGVDVRIVLEQSDWNEDVTADNFETGAYLENYGIDVRYDPLTVTTHCKTFIIDTLLVLVGSTNWSYSAVSSNNEANVLIEGREIAESFDSYFQTLWNNSYDR